MKKLITTALATMVAFYGYSQTYLPLTGGTLTGGSAAGIQAILTLKSNQDPADWSSGITRLLLEGKYGYSSHVSSYNNNNYYGTRLRLQTASNTQGLYNYGIQLDEFGNTTLGGTLTSTSATFSSKLQVSQSASGTPRIPVLGSTNDWVSAYLTNADTAYGLMTGSLWNGNTWLQVQRTDGTASAYNMLLQPNGGNVGIGTTTPSEMLSVNGKIRAREIKVETNNWPDYVFHTSYKLPDLKATEQFIKQNNHLPEIPSAAEVAKEGVNLGEMNALLLKKIEELTLYMIEQNKLIQLQNDRIANLEKKSKNK